MMVHIKELNLSKKECDRLIEILNDYHKDRSVGNLVKRLIGLLQPVEYLPLLKDIKNSIFKHHCSKFDNIINTYLFGPQELSSKSHRKSQSALSPKECLYHSLCSDYVRKGIYTFKVVTIEKVSDDVGIFICEKTENVPGIKVGNVTHGSIAHRKDVRKGDYIIELNGKQMKNIALKNALRIFPLLTSIHLVIKRPNSPLDSQCASYNPWYGKLFD